METKQCPVCWGWKVTCVGLTANDDPILEPCTGCNGTGWLTYGNLLKEGERKVITCNFSESLTVGWDGTRVILCNKNKFTRAVHTIILNPKEAYKLVKFIISLGGNIDKES